MSFDLYQAITDRIIAALEKGTCPWRKPWMIGGSRLAISYSTGKPYSLLNQLLLNEPGEYITFNQAIEAGGHVRKGAKAKFVVFWKMLEKENKETGEKETIPFLKYYNVFHINNQCEGISPKYAVSVVQPVSDLKPNEVAEKVIQDYVTRSGVKLDIRESSSAYYKPSTDTIVVPKMDQYKLVERYYSTIFHEMAHSTGSVGRLERFTGEAATAAFGNTEYSKEELIAELSAAFLVNYCALETAASFDNSAAYIQNWLEALKNDKHLIVSAAGKAEKAANYILGTEEEEENNGND